MLQRAVVLFGGPGAERFVSVASAQHIAEHVPSADFFFLDEAGTVAHVGTEQLRAHKDPFHAPFVTQDDAERMLLAAFLSLHTDAGVPVFLALHGDAGENGLLQAQCESVGVLFTGSSAAASARAFDKSTALAALAAAGACVPDGATISSADAAALREAGEHMLMHGTAVFLKPAQSGSSVGLYRAHDTASLAAAIAQITVREPEEYRVETAIVGRELTVGVLERPDGTRVALPCSETSVPPDALFDYAHKYDGGAQETTPARITPDENARAQELALLAHETLGCSGYSRTDLFLTGDGVVFLETNTLPGLTKASFFPQQLAAAGIPFPRFFADQMQIAQQRGPASAAS